MLGSKPHLLFFFSIFTSISLSDAVQLILVNNCPYSIWPGILGSAGRPSPQNGGFHLGVGEEFVLDVSYGWSGRIWARQGCCFDEQGKGSCDSGDCNGQLHCNGLGGAPPATVIEMTFGTSKSPLHFYDVSLVDGFNIPVSMTPIGGGIGCGVAACEVDLNVCCPSRFEARKHGKVVGCLSACLALNTDKYCCKGEYGSPGSCRPTLFSHIFKSICPDAYSFAYDDSASLKSCNRVTYNYEAPASSSSPLYSYSDPDLNQESFPHRPVSNPSGTSEDGWRHSPSSNPRHSSSP